MSVARSIFAALIFVLLWNGIAHAQTRTPEASAQQQLKDLGYPIGKVDGIWGPKSTAAMIEYQKRSGLAETGLPDKASVMALTATSTSLAPAPAAPTPLLTPSLPQPDANARPPIAPLVTEPSDPAEIAETTSPDLAQSSTPSSPTQTASVASPQTAPEVKEPVSGPPSQSKENASAEASNLLVIVILLAIPAVGIYALFRNRRWRIRKQAEDGARAQRDLSTDAPNWLFEPAPNSPSRAPPPEVHQSKLLRPAGIPLGAESAARLKAHNDAVGRAIRGRHPDARNSSGTSAPAQSMSTVNAQVPAPLTPIAVETPVKEIELDSQKRLQTHNDAVNDVVRRRAQEAREAAARYASELSSATPEGTVELEFNLTGVEQAALALSQLTQPDAPAPPQALATPMHTAKPDKSRVMESGTSQMSPVNASVPLAPIAVETPVMEIETDTKKRLQAHNDAVNDVVRRRAQEAEELAAKMASQPLSAPPVNTVKLEFNFSGAVKASPGFSPSARPNTPAVLRIPPQPTHMAKPKTPWISESETIQIGQHKLTRGLVYVGDHLQKQNGWSGRDNCLIVPSLPVANRADVSGQYLDYWPSYEQLAPSSRKAYLDWLSGDRSNPSTPIGYVFLYFYGLERRLMLDQSLEDRPAIATEVERLLSIYGDNRSFLRYASELLAADKVMAGAIDQQDTTRAFIGGGAVPMSVLIELGRRASTGQPIAPSLLLSLTVNHPETRIRTPAKRLFHLVERRFAEKIAVDHPAGLILALPRHAPKLQSMYKAASNTFEVPIVPESLGFPDISALPQPLGYGRALLKDITNELDGYSREIGKTGGTPTTLASMSKLPPDLAQTEAETLPGSPLLALAALAESHKIIKSAELVQVTGGAGDGTAKSRLKDLAQCLRTWRYGIVPDPAFAPKIIADWDDVILFRWAAEEEMPASPSQSYQIAYLSLALGVVVARADGDVSDTERNLLKKVILESPGLNGNERRRLVNEARWLEANPLALSDLRQWLKDASAEFRQTVMTNLLPVASADGRIAGEEVTALEKISKMLGLDKSSVYEGLAGSRPSVDDDLAMVEASKPYVGASIPASPKPTGPGGINSDRLAAIRAETLGTARILSEIFADEDEADLASAIPAFAPADDGLDSRHRALLDEILTRPEWSKADFERLVRQSSLMPGSVITTLNEWSLQLCDELVLEGDDPIVINAYAILESA